MTLTAITVTGTFTRPDGTAMTGTGTATLSHRLVNGTTVIEPTPIPFMLSSTGTVVNLSGLPLVLDANDDAATAPVGSFYTFTLTLDDAPLDPFDVFIPHTAAGGTVDLSTLIPALP